MIAGYQAGGGQEYLDRAIANAQYLIDGSTSTSDGGMWFPYSVDYEVHQDPKMTLKAPWYSGMAQGMVLSIVSRLYNITKDSKWKTDADAIVKTFTPGKKADGPWFSYVDDNHNLWFEEYPGTATPTHVVNGDIYAAWGLDDYIGLVNPGDSNAVQLFNGAMTTIKNHFADYRYPGGVSYYCIAQYCKDTDWRPDSYHRGVTYQLGVLANMTGDKTFADQSQELYNDSH